MQGEKKNPSSTNTAIILMQDLEVILLEIGNFSALNPNDSFSRSSSKLKLGRNGTVEGESLENDSLPKSCY